MKIKTVVGHRLTYMTAKPTFLLFVWFADQKLHFSLIEDMGYPQAKQFYEYHKMFNGRAACVFTFFSDYDIRDEQLKQVATSFMKGEYIRYDIDLYNLTLKTSQGVNRTNPHQ